jgi:YVTN family beta-propeller protein
MSGCTQAPPTIPVGNGPQGVAVNPLTDTVYVSNGGDGTVSVIDGATCNASHTGGCGQTPQTVTVGNSPYPIDVDQRTDTVYVGNVGDSTLSLINGATCNATATCTQNSPAVPIEQWPFGIAVDQQSGTVYLTSIIDADVATINGQTCKATNLTGCRPAPVPERMGGFGGAIALDPTADTLTCRTTTTATLRSSHFEPRDAAKHRTGHEIISQLEEAGAPSAQSERDAWNASTAA